MTSKPKSELTKEEQRVEATEAYNAIDRPAWEAYAAISTPARKDYRAKLDKINAQPDDEIITVKGRKYKLMKGSDE